MTSPSTDSSSMPLFSVIIPAYNRAHLIAACIESVFRQEFTDWEVVVADDGSSDDTVAVASQFGPRVRVLRQANKGPGAARNLACEHARGEYLAFLDSDDVWFPWTLGTYASLIRQHGRPAMVSSLSVPFGDAGELSKVVHEPERASVFQDVLSYFAQNPTAWIPTCGVAVRADAYRAAGGFTEKRVTAEDTDFWLRVGTARGFVRVAAPPTFGQRRHGSNVSGNLDLWLKGVWNLVDAERGNQYPGGPQRQRERVALMTVPIRAVSVSCLKGGRVRAGWELYRQCFAWHVRMWRWRYVLGFPVMAAGTYLGRAVGRQGRGSERAK